MDRRIYYGFQTGSKARLYCVRRPVPAMGLSRTRYGLRRRRAGTQATSENSNRPPAPSIHGGAKCAGNQVARRSASHVSSAAWPIATNWHASLRSPFEGILDVICWSRVLRLVTRSCRPLGAERNHFLRPSAASGRSRLRASRGLQSLLWAGIALLLMITVSGA